MQKPLQLRETNITQFIMAWMPNKEMNCTREDVLNLVRSKNNIQFAITNKSLNLESELENEGRLCFEYDENQNLKENLSKFKQKFQCLFSPFDSNDNLRNQTKIVILMINNTKNQILLLICMKIYFNHWENDNEYDYLTKLFINQWEDLKVYIDYFAQLEIKPQKPSQQITVADTDSLQESNIIPPAIDYIIPPKIDYPKFIMKHR